MLYHQVDYDIIAGRFFNYYSNVYIIYQNIIAGGFFKGWTAHYARLGPHTVL
jgi:hypothetical protein